MPLPQAASDTPTAGSADLAEPEYRSLSGLSVLGMLLGLASAAYLAAPMLVVLPVAAAAVCLLACRKVAANPEVLTGRGLALIGLAAALACLATGVARDAVTKWLLTSQSAPVAEAWLERVLAGEIEQAYLLTAFPGEVGRPSPAAPERGAPKSPEELVAEYGKNRTVAAIESIDPAGPPRWGAAGAPAWLRAGRVLIAHRCLIPAASGGELPVRVTVERWLPRDGENAIWRVYEASLGADE